MQRDPEYKASMAEHEAKLIKEWIIDKADTFADDYCQQWQKLEYLKDVFGYRLTEILGEEFFNDWSWDWYDTSIKIYGTEKNAVLTKEQQEKIFAMGWKIIFIYESDGEEDTRTVYCSKKHGESGAV